MYLVNLPEDLLWMPACAKLENLNLHGIVRHDFIQKPDPENSSLVSLFDLEFAMNRMYFYRKLATALRVYHVSFIDDKSQI